MKVIFIAIKVYLSSHLILHIVLMEDLNCTHHRHYIIYVSTTLRVAIPKMFLTPKMVSMKLLMPKLVLDTSIDIGRK